LEASFGVKNPSRDAAEDFGDGDWIGDEGASAELSRSACGGLFMELLDSGHGAIRGVVGGK
jgi:hypothetical protein